jgi:hypothetical protein
MLDPPSWATFKDVYQLAYVATDADRAMALFREHHGIPVFKDMGPITLALDSGDVMTIRIAMCFVGPLQVEIIQPMGGADWIYRDALPSSGFGMTWHHFARRISSLDALESLKADLMRQGHNIAISGGDPAVARFFYVDARPTLAHYVEYLYVSPERLAFHAALPRY